MANTKISAASALSSVGDTDQIPVASGGASKSAVGTKFYRPGATDVAVADGGTGASTAANARTNLGLVIGTNVAAQTHATQHNSGGSDAIKLDELGAPTDVTTLNASVSAHGLQAKLPAGALSSFGLVPIRQSVLAAPATNFDFTSIEQVYSHLRLVLMVGTDQASAQTAQLKFNNDGTAIYDYENYDSSGTLIASSQQLAQTSFSAAIASKTGSTSPGICVVEIPFYTLTVFNKTMSARYGWADSTSTTDIHDRSNFGRWRSTAAITRITVTCATGNFVVGSAAHLYGIV